MSDATNTRLMDTSPGGENTQFVPPPTPLNPLLKLLPLSPYTNIYLNTRYESTATFTKPHAKSSGQFGGTFSFSSSLKSHSILNQTSLATKLIITCNSDSNTTEASQQAQDQKKERGEKTAENIRFGESISEHGFGGETVGNTGAPGLGSESEGEQTRREQGYGGGSGVGG
jgi:hypothetical protein